MKSANFFKSKLFLIQVGVALLITVVLVWITLISLKWYTHHGEELSVPDVYGMNISDAETAITQGNLRFTVYDSVYNSKFEPGAVLDQQPKAGAIVKRNRNIFLTINSLKPEQVRFPNLVDNSFRQAYEMLLTSGFKVGKLEYEENQFFNLVLYPKYNGDSIAAGSKIDKGATIDLVLGKGNNRRILAPNLMGKSIQQAKENILLSNMNIGRIDYDDSMTSRMDSLRGKVYMQTPQFSNSQYLRPGTTINFYVSVDSVRLHEADSLLQRRLDNLPY